MFAIVFVWTPPHFWALALMIKEHYANASVPMLPVVKGDRATARQIVWYTVVLIAGTLAPVAFGVFGLVYGVAARCSARSSPGTRSSCGGTRRARRGASVPLLAAVPRAPVRRHGDRYGDLMTTETPRERDPAGRRGPRELELRRKNMRWGWALLGALRPAVRRHRRVAYIYLWLS